MPKWILTVAGAVSMAIFTGFIGWMTSLESRISASSISTAELRVRQDTHSETLNDLRDSMSKLSDKIDTRFDALLKKLEEMRPDKNP